MYFEEKAEKCGPYCFIGAGESGEADDVLAIMLYRFHYFHQ